MKKNNKTYLLLALVLGIWGVIGFKVFSRLNPEKNDVEIDVSTKNFIPQKVRKKDTFSINANYRDPFLGTIKKPKQKIKKGPLNAKPKVEPLTKKILYTGFITDKNENRKIFFVTIDGEQYMMSINDTFQDVTLINGTTRSIRVNYKGISKNISLSE